MARVALVNLASLPMPGNDPIFPIGLRTVQDALERHGHETALIDFLADPHMYEDLAWVSEGWDAIGFAIRNIDPIILPVLIRNRFAAEVAARSELHS